MTQLLFLLLSAAAPTAAPAATTAPIIFLDPRPGPMPVTDKDLRPGRVPDCNDREYQQYAAEQRIKGWPTPECMENAKDPLPPRQPQH